MKTRLLILLLLVGVVSCDGMGFMTRGTSTQPEPVAAKPVPSREPAAEAVVKRIQKMETRVPAPTPPAPLPVVPPTDATQTRAPAAPAPTEPPKLTDLIASLEDRKQLTSDEQFELDVLRALKASRDRKSLVPRLYPDAAKGYEPALNVMVLAMETCEEGKADETLARLREAEGMLLENSSVRIPSAVFCDEAKGFGIYTPRKTTTFARGEWALVYLEIVDFKCQKRGDLWEYRLSCEASLLDLAGRVAKQIELKTKTGTFTTRSYVSRQFYPLHFQVPADVYAGEYVLRVTVTDELKKQFVEERVKMQVR